MSADQTGDRYLEDDPLNITGYEGLEISIESSGKLGAAFPSPRELIYSLLQGVSVTGNISTTPNYSPDYITTIRDFGTEFRDVAIASVDALRQLFSDGKVLKFTAHSPD